MIVAGSSRTRAGAIGAQVFLFVLAVAWMVPLVLVVFVSLRPYHDTLLNGYLSRPETLNLDNYRLVFAEGDLQKNYWNTFLILVPSLFLLLWFSSMLAFVASRFSWRFNTTLLVLFTAGNLLPPQIIVQPLFQMYKRVPLPELFSNSGALLGSTWGIIFIHVAYQSGFCTFILSNYMKTLPPEITQSAIIDGAGPWDQYWRIMLPLCRPVIAALAALEFTWIYNDFFWALIFEQQYSDRPITSSLANISSGFFVDRNLVSAASVVIAAPPVIAFVFLQRHFLSGLTLGATSD